MCGVFGFVSNDTGAGPDLKVLKEIARVTQTRGNHAFGFAWIDSRGRLKSFRARGPISDGLGYLNMAHDARMLIGHCRWATAGDPMDNINNHPHPADGGWLVHNGVIQNYQGLIWEHDLEPSSECDSELLGLLIEKFDGSLLNRCIKAAKATRSQPLVMLGLWPRPERLIAIRDGNPLYTGKTHGATYLGSLSLGLPGKVSQVNDGEAMEFTIDETQPARV